MPKLTKHRLENMSAQELLSELKGARVVTKCRGCKRPIAATLYIEGFCSSFHVPIDIIRGLDPEERFSRAALRLKAGLGISTRFDHRDLTVGSATQGGDFVQTTIKTPLIELVRNRCVPVLFAYRCNGSLRSKRTEFCIERSALVFEFFFGQSWCPQLI